jgi:hypothetical protein
VNVLVKFAIALCAFSFLFFDGAWSQAVLADGLEYDQIVFQSADTTSHPPGSFATDLAANEAATLDGELGTAASRKRLAALLSQANDPVQKAAMMVAAQIPFLGTLGAIVASNALRAHLQEEGKGIGSQIRGAQKAEERLGKWYHVVYLNGWTRREDVANQTVLIIKADQNKRIYLDLALQTYYTTPATDTPKSEADARAVLCSPSTTVDGGPHTLDGIPTELFTSTFTAPKLTFTATRYESQYTEPPKRDTAGNLIPFDCPAGASHTGPPMPTDRVALYSSTVATQGAMMVSTLEETGNIKQVDEDAALFEIPPGFKVKSSGILGP